MNQEIVFKENDIVQGIVTSIKKYGAFLSFESGYVGLLHISEISDSFINDISNYIKIGDTISVLVKEVDEKTQFLKVSIKDLPQEQNPFKNYVPPKRVTSYKKSIDFSKLDKQLKKMIEEELEREKKNGSNSRI